MALGLLVAEMWALSGTMHVRYLLDCIPLVKLARQESAFSVKHVPFVSISFEGVCVFFFPGSHIRLV